MNTKPVINNKEEVPFAHYQALYETLNPEDTARRCAVEYQKEHEAFLIKFLGEEHFIGFPKFWIKRKDSNEIEDIPIYQKILLIRYLIEGKNLPSTGKFNSYREFPWGEVYYNNFYGRCILRFVHTFGKIPEKFKEIMESLGAKKISDGDYGYEIEFLNNLYLRLILWQGDEEFAPSGQILFSANFGFAFTAEDMAVVGDTVNYILKKHGENPAHNHEHGNEHIHEHSHEHTHEHTHHHTNTKAVINRLSRAIGHMESVKKMVEDGKDCSEVLIQLSAVKSAINNTGKIILKDHIEHCIVDAVESGDQKAIDDLNVAIDRFMK